MMRVYNISYEVWLDSIFDQSAVKRPTLEFSDDEKVSIEESFHGPVDVDVISS